ncbi:MAG: hypothetical protein R3220_07780 [Balneolaceae bacterium]|nr:hypothetical protein [Balneolaceae bacterium]
MITVKPYGGLGNRIRVLYSTLALNTRLGDSIKIIWDCGTELNCPFEELFLIPQNCTVKNIHQGVYRDITRFALKRMRLKKFREYFYDFILYGTEVREYVDNQNQFVEDCKNRSVYIETCHSFYWQEKSETHLQPTPFIREEAKNIYKNFSSNTYGIHIRMKDKFQTKEISHPSAFKKLMRDMIEADDSAQFFLSTDSKKVENDFVKEFQEKVITSGEKVLNRNSPAGIKSAWVDILCLSKTKKIYGTYGSSFSSVPGLFTGVSCESVVAENS